MPEPQHTFRVEAVDRLVEHHRRGVTQQRRGDPKPLAHPEGEAPGGTIGDIGQADDVEHLLHTLVGDAARGGECPKMVASRSFGVHCLCFEQRTEFTERRSMFVQASPVHRCRTARWSIETQDHPHRGRLAGAVGAEKAKNLSGWGFKTDAV